MDRSRYPDNWEEISDYVRFERAGGCCEWCGAEHGTPHPDTGSTVVLTTAHLDHDPSNPDPENLRALCQRCHLRYDAAEHARHAAETRRQAMIEAGQLELRL
jgi:5-methylcytosine-specific restriction endonuclease McrA